MQQAATIKVTLSVPLQNHHQKWSLLAGTSPTPRLSHTQCLGGRNDLLLALSFWQWPCLKFEYAFCGCIIKIPTNVGFV